MAQQQHTTAEHRQHLTRFYELLDHLRTGLGGARELQNCDGRMNWPPRGLYFFFEPGEHRSEVPSVRRVVRVGTHAVSQGSKSTLWKRLHNHRGTSQSGGNHRGSVFRQHIGKAMLNRSAGKFLCPTWGDKNQTRQAVRASESELEKLVSQHLGKMPFLWLAIDDEPSKTSLRKYMERQSIGLLTWAKPSIDPPSSNWLGNFSTEPAICRTGLWNLDDVDAPYEPAFLNVLAKLAEATLEHHRPKQHQTSQGAPSRFEASIGGYTGPSFDVRWNDGVLAYSRYDTGYKAVEQTTLTPSHAAWETFWSTLEHVGVWSWNEKYVQDGVCDGTHWAIELEAGGRRLSSHGDNAYPKKFNLWCKAVEVLISRRSFR